MFSIFSFFAPCRCAHRIQSANRLHPSFDWIRLLLWFSVHFVRDLDSKSAAAAVSCDPPLQADWFSSTTLKFFTRHMRHIEASWSQKLHKEKRPPSPEHKSLFFTSLLLIFFIHPLDLFLCRADVWCYRDGRRNPLHPMLTIAWCGDSTLHLHCKKCQSKKSQCLKNGVVKKKNGKKRWIVYLFYMLLL